MADKKNSPRVQIPMVNRHAEWLDMYTRGHTYRDIADEYDVAFSTVHEAIHRQLDKARERRNELADVALEIQLSRYDWLYKQACEALADARDGREMGVAQLLAAARGILDSKSKLLGLDQGVTVTVHSESILDRELAELTAQMNEVIDAEAVELPRGADDA